MKDNAIKILAIETSCDETSAAIIQVTKGYEELQKVTRSYNLTQPLVTNSNYRQPIVTILSNIVSSQVKLHAKYGGVYPELASREHIRNILPVIKQAMTDLNSNFKIQILNEIQNSQPKADPPLAENALKFNHLKLIKNLKFKIENCFDCIAVTTGPGLIGSLLVGVNTAKTLAYTLNKPIYAINHLEGHIYSNFVRENSKFEIRSTKLETNSNIQNPKRFENSNLENSKIVSNFDIRYSKLPKFPILALIVSGGHTSLVYMKNHLNYKIIGETLDDAAGEAFDKVGTLLGLSYPGGPAIAKMAEKVKSKNEKVKTTTQNLKLKFPRPMLESNNFNFSFSGLKTAVLYTVKKLPKPLSIKTKQLICKEFQDAVVETLVAKTLKAAKKFKAKSVLLCGGVAANSCLRDEFKFKIKNSCLGGRQVKFKIEFFVPEKSLCTDNAAMIGAAAAYKIALGIKPDKWYNMNADPNKKL